MAAGIFNLPLSADGSDKLAYLLNLNDLSNAQMAVLFGLAWRMAFPNGLNHPRRDLGRTSDGREAERETEREVAIVNGHLDG